MYISIVMYMVLTAVQWIATEPGTLGWIQAISTKALVMGMGIIGYLIARDGT